MRKPVILAFLASWAILLTPVHAGDELARRLDEVLRSNGYENGHWGALVIDRDSGGPLFERNADQLFRPASVTKLFSTAAALIELGPEFRFQTPVYRRGEIDAEGTLHGDLILVASGDPSLGGRTGPDGALQFTDIDHSYAGGSLNAALVPSAPLAGLESLARDIQTAKIKAITGDVIIDDRLFPPAPATGSGPSRVVPILVNDNLIDVLVTPGGKAGDAATLRLIPETSFASVDNQVVTGAAGGKPVVAVEPQGPRRFRVLGSLPVGHAPVVKVYEVEEPASLARAALIEAIRRRGVRVVASPLGPNPVQSLPNADTIAKLPKVAEYTSPPFREYAKVILKVSQNLHASLLPILLAVRQGTTSLEDGLRRQGEILKALGLDIHTISFGGGAGGSNSDLATPRATVTLLRAMAARPEFPAYKAALPVLGRDGTLAKAIEPDSPARGHVQAKTGTYWVENGLDGRAVLTSKALAGYIETASGRNLVFAFFVNNVPLDVESADVSEATAAAGRLLGRLCEVLYDDAPRPSAAVPSTTTTPGPAVRSP